MWDNMCCTYHVVLSTKSHATVNMVFVHNVFKQCMEMLHTKSVGSGCYSPIVSKFGYITVTET